MKNVVIGQINPAPGDIWGNKDKIEKTIAQARDLGGTVVVFPQFSLCGVPVHDLLFHRDFVSDIETALVAIAAHTEGLVVILGTVFSDGSLVHDGAVIFCNGHEVGRQHVMAQLWELNGKSIGILVGESFSTTFSSTPDIVFHLVASAWTTTITQKRFAVANDIVSHTSSPYLLVNLVGGNDGWIFDGASFLLADDGRLLFQAQAFTEGAFLVQEGACVELSKPIESLSTALRLGISDFFHKLRKKRACIFLSGSVDSVVVATLAVQALGLECVQAFALDPVPELGIPVHSLPEAIETLARKFPDRAPALLSAFFSQEEDVLCLSSENKSDLMGGRCADRSLSFASLAPLGDLFATKVQELAPHGLSSNVVADTVLDSVLLHLFVQGETVEETALLCGLSKDAVCQIASRALQSEYRRRQVLCILKVSSQTTSMYPIVNRYQFAKFAHPVV